MATAIVTVLFVVPAQAEAAATGPTDAICEGLESDFGTPETAVECASFSAVDDVYSCVHVDPGTIPPGVVIHWEHCFQKIVYLPH